MSIELKNEELTDYGSFKRKLELCRSFAETGSCGYGGNCFFAHGV